MGAAACTTACRVGSERAVRGCDARARGPATWRLEFVPAESYAAFRGGPEFRSIFADEGDQLALNAYPVGRKNAHFVGSISGLQRNGCAAPTEALQSGLFIIDMRNDDIARFGDFCPFQERNVPVENAGFDHAVPAHLEGEMVAGREHLRGHLDDVGLVLNCLDGGARRDASHDRHGNGSAAFVIRPRPHTTEMSLDDIRPEAAATTAAGQGLWQLEHLDRPGAVGQAADKTALLERCHEAMNP